MRFKLNPLNLSLIEVNTCLSHAELLLDCDHELFYQMTYIDGYKGYDTYEWWQILMNRCRRIRYEI